MKFIKVLMLVAVASLSMGVFACGDKDGDSGGSSDSGE